MAEWANEHGLVVYRYLRAILRNSHDAHDLTQDVFCRAWQANGRYREQGQARAYLLRIADRLARDRWRRPQLEETLSDAGWQMLGPCSEGDDPAAQAMRAEATRRLHAALDRLTPLQRRALLLRYYGQLTFEQIAETLGCPLSTALSHCRRGLEMLRRQFAEDAS